MNWDKPFHIDREEDGTYLQFGKPVAEKPRWYLGTPRQIVAVILTAIFFIWVELEEAVFSTIVDRIIVGGIAVVAIIQYVISISAWRKF